MLDHPRSRLLALRLTGMAKALSEQLDLPESQALSFEERLGLLVDREMTMRSDRRLTTRLRQAKLRLSACLEDLDYRHPRGLDKALMLRLVTCQWIRDRHNVLIRAPAGSGKPGSRVPWAIRPVVKGTRYLPAAAPPPGTAHCQGDGRYPKLMASLAKTALRFSMTGDWPLSVMRTAAMSLNCWKTGTAVARHCREPFPVEHGMRPWGIDPG